MRSLRLVAALARTALFRRSAFAFGLALFLALAAAAQQPAAGRQRVPRLTTEDVARPPAEQPVEESNPAAGKTEEAKKPGEAAATTAQPTAGEQKVSAEESSWRDRVGKAHNRAKELERAAEEAELRITALRNQLGTSGESARYRNDVAAQMDQAGRQLTELRAQAHAAADDLAELVDYGKAKSFTEAEGPKPLSEKGQPNEEYYRGRFAKLTVELETAQRRIQLYSDRVRDVNQQLSTNSSGKDKSGRKTGGDSFFAGQLQKDREEAQQKLDEARRALAKAQSDFEDLREEARRAGLPPAVFR
jgi:chromosome segregation ATPase